MTATHHDAPAKPKNGAIKVRDPEWERIKRELKEAFGYVAVVGTALLAAIALIFIFTALFIAFDAGPRDEAREQFSNSCKQAFRAQVYTEECIDFLR